LKQSLSEEVNRKHLRDLEDDIKMYSIKIRWNVFHLFLLTEDKDWSLAFCANSGLVKGEYFFDQLSHY
jgi:hypothetical protein